MKIGDIFGAGDIANLVNNVIDRALPDKEKADEAKFKVQELLQNGELAKLANETQLFQAEVDDRKSARTIHTNFVDFLAVAVICGSGYMIHSILVNGISKEINDMTGGMIIQFIISAPLMVLAYYFGSSSSSKLKTVAMAEAIKK